jgi:pimeloyl-ACP methyl ester carboxylesterase
MAQLTVHGVDVFYRDEGQGPPIILGHSATGSSGQWRELIGQLSGRYRLIAPDHLGYGRTGPYPGESQMFELEVSIIEALIELADMPVHLIGHSYGGYMLTRTAIRMSGRLQSLSLIEPTLFHLLGPAERFEEHAEIKAVADRVVHHVDSGNPREAARGFIDYWVGLNAFDKMNERVQGAIISGMPKLRAEWQSAFDQEGASVDALKNIAVPIQLIRGTKTTRAASAVMEVLKEVWPAARYSEIRDADHMSPLTHSREVNALLEEFLDQQQAAT